MAMVHLCSKRIPLSADFHLYESGILLSYPHKENKNPLYQEKTSSFFVTFPRGKFHTKLPKKGCMENQTNFPIPRIPYHTNAP